MGLTDAHIGSELICRGTRLINESGPALVADGSRIGRVRLTDGFRAYGAGRSGAVSMIATTITGDLYSTDAALTNNSGPALFADRCDIGGDFVLATGFRASGAGQAGTVRLNAARISGEFYGGDAELVNESGPALVANRCEVGSFILTVGFCAEASGRTGAVSLDGARINGRLNARGPKLLNKAGPAFSADGCEIGSDLIFTEGLNARGTGELGAVRLLGARIAGDIIFADATIVNDSGSAMSADRCQVGGDAIFSTGFQAHGSGRSAALCLLGARITGQLSGRGGAYLTSSTNTALSLEQVQVGGPVFLDGDFIASGGGRSSAINLLGARLRELRVNDRVRHSENSQDRWNIDGCTYIGLPGPNDRDWWLRLLREATPAYAAQPYQQLAAVHRAAGHDRDVRAILIAQRRDQIKRGHLTGRDRMWAKFTGLVLGFGWEPWRALYGLAGVFALSIVLAVVLGGHGALIHTPRPGIAAEPCTFVEQVGVGLDLGTPLFGSAARSRDLCQLNTDRAPAATTALVVSTWALQFCAWGLAVLFIAGFTGAVRKT